MRIAPDARVLVVDDNETNLLVAKSLLKRTKVKLDTALSGAKCIELLENNRAWFLYKKTATAFAAAAKDRYFLLIRILHATISLSFMIEE